MVQKNPSLGSIYTPRREDWTGKDISLEVENPPPREGERDRFGGASYAVPILFFAASKASRHGGLMQGAEPPQ